MNFKTLRKGDLVIVDPDNAGMFNLAKNGFVLGEVWKGSKYPYKFCKVNILVQTGHYYNTSWPIALRASSLRKLDLPKAKRKRTRRVQAI
jgi:hypothetical protein